MVGVFSPCPASSPSTGSVGGFSLDILVRWGFNARERGDGGWSELACIGSLELLLGFAGGGIARLAGSEVSALAWEGREGSDDDVEMAVVPEPAGGV